MHVGIGAEKEVGIGAERGGEGVVGAHISSPSHAHSFVSLSLDSLPMPDAICFDS